MEFIEDRHGRKSTVIASQILVQNLYNILSKNPTIADAIIDRMSNISPAKSIDSSLPASLKLLNGTSVLADVRC